MPPQAKARGTDLGELLAGNSPAVSNRGGFDIGSFNLTGPVEKPANTVQPAAFQQTARRVPPKRRTAGFRSAVHRTDRRSPAGSPIRRLRLDAETMTTAIPTCS